MVSLIDPSKPATGVPASKADLRANLAAARAGLEALQDGSWLMPEPTGVDQSADFNALQQAALDDYFSTGGPYDVVIRFRPGTYRLRVVCDPRTSLVGAPRATFLKAPAAGSYILSYDFPDPPHYPSYMFGSPFMRDIAIDGEGTSDGLRVRNQGGLKIERVNINSCIIGLYSQDNYYGAWYDLHVNQCETGLYFDDHPTGHACNKTLFAPEIRLNKIGLFVRSNANLKVIGGTIEGNQEAGILLDGAGGGYNENGVLNKHRLAVDGSWFELNGDYSSSFTRNGVTFYGGDIVILNSVMLVENTNVWLTYVNGAQSVLDVKYSDVAVLPGTRNFVENGGRIIDRGEANIATPVAPPT